MTNVQRFGIHSIASSPAKVVKNDTPVLVYEAQEFKSKLRYFSIIDCIGFSDAS